jgi:mono/diheme cytochrome c family protein
MTSNISRLFAPVVAAVALIACHRGVSVSSPTPVSSAGTGAATAATTSGLPADVTPAMIEEGKALFAGAPCAKCHGAGGTGGQNGPNLTDATWVQGDGSFAFILKTIQTGVPKASVKGTYPFAMRPTGGGTFSDAQVRSIAAYVYSISHK